MDCLTFARQLEHVSDVIPLPLNWKHIAHTHSLSAFFLTVKLLMLFVDSDEN